MKSLRGDCFLPAAPEFNCLDRNRNTKVRELLQLTVHVTSDATLWGAVPGRGWRCTLEQDDNLSGPVFGMLKERVGKGEKELLKWYLF